MWAKLLAVGAATVLAIRSTTPPNPPAPKDPESKVVDEGRLAGLLVQKVPVLFVLFYGMAFLAYVFIMWDQETTGTLPSQGSRFAEWYISDALGLVAIAIGAGLRMWCYSTLARHFTFTVTILRDHELVGSGPYALLLHPSYTGALLLQGGYLVLMVWDRLWYYQPWPLSLVRFDLAMLVLALLAVGAFYKRVTAEEDALRRHFGKRWDAHAATRKRFIPFVF